MRKTLVTVEHASAAATDRESHCLYRGGLPAGEDADSVEFSGASPCTKRLGSPAVCAGAASAPGAAARITADAANTAKIAHFDMEFFRCESFPKDFRVV